MVRFTRTAAAEDDLDAIWSYVAQHNPAAADSLYWRLDAKTVSLAHSPGIGALRPDLGPGIRAIPVNAYLILYRETEDGILVLRYLHGARDLPSIPLDP